MVEESGGGGSTETQKPINEWDGMKKDDTRPLYLLLSISLLLMPFRIWIPPSPSLLRRRQRNREMFARVLYYHCCLMSLRLRLLRLSSPSPLPFPPTFLYRSSHQPSNSIQTRTNASCEDCTSPPSFSSHSSPSAPPFSPFGPLTPALPLPLIPPSPNQTGR
ncbi:hypothetical protein D9757_012386 [Collybiopsis confluens]|uniref:Uncharacterized protein n=1 Tax=Collybiopsis confluens TaxID=2823264 RepID=A0A8H5LQR4_9AGAR|nr:hypothetical protein D9757_012386 [Collybiopsis confluens]